MYIRAKRKNETLFIESEPTETTADLKKKIAAVVEKTPSSLRLLFQDNVLDDETTLSDANIENDAILHLVYKVPGSDEYEEVALE